MSYHCFISYARDDLHYAEELHRQLKAKGFDVWFDKERLQPGFDWYREIEKGCEQSRVFLPVLTPRWQESPWTRYETYGAEFVIPLLYEGDWDKVAPAPLMRFQNVSIDFTRPSENDLGRLFASIRSLLEKPEPVKTEALAFVRHWDNRFFVGREREMNEIYEHLFQKADTNLSRSRVEVITALGGMGKTTLARQYVEKFWRCYRQIFWVNCREGIEIGFAKIAEALWPNLRGTNNDPLRVKSNAEAALFELKQSIGRQNRLLILDDAEEKQPLLDWVPNVGSCHTLITSRFSDWLQGFSRTPLWILEVEPARKFLLDRTGRKAEQASLAEIAECDALARKLEYLPLALEQAAAFISEEGAGFSFADYLRLYAQFPEPLLNRLAPSPTDYPDSVFRTWRMTIDKLPAGARAMLRLASFMGAAPVPFELFLRAARILGERARQLARNVERPPEADGEPDELQIRNWKKALVAYSMVRMGEAQDFAVHSLVQKVERYDVAPAEQLGWWEEAMEALMAFAPQSAETFENWPKWRVALPHAEVMWRQALEDPRIRPPVALLRQMAAFLFVLGRPADALGPARMDVELRRSSNDLESSEMLTSMELLGQILRRTGGMEEGEALLRRVLERRRNLLGAEDRHTLASMNTLAGLLAAKGERAEARNLYEEALAIGERVLKLSDHRDLLYNRNDLAHLLDLLGEYRNSEDLYRQALAGFERTLPAEHPDTFVCLQNLAGVLQSQGRFEQSEERYWDALGGLERTMGANHPLTLTCMENLATVLTELNNQAVDLVGCGEHEHAEALFRHVLESRKRLLKADHPETLQSVRNLAFCLKRLGPLVEAEVLFQEAIRAYAATPHQNSRPPATTAAFQLTVSKYRELLKQKGLSERQLDAKLTELDPVHQAVSPVQNDDNENAS